MTGINTTSTASLGALAGQVQALMSNPQVAAALGGGGAAANPTAPAAGANAAAPAAGQLAETTGRTNTGQIVKIVKDPTTQKATLVPRTGKPETVSVLDANGQPTGTTLLFGANGVETRNFEVAAKTAIFQPVLDRRDGIASGITNLSRVVAARHERLKALQDALAQDANANGGSANQMDLQQLVQEQQITEHISNLNHKIYESVQNAITPWLR